MTSTQHPLQPNLSNPIFTETTKTTSSSLSSPNKNITKFQSSSATPQNTEPIANPSPTSPTEPHHSDGRRNSSGQILPSPSENWKPTFNRVQSWNREDRKREIVLKREIAQHEGHGGGFSEKK